MKRVALALAFIFWASAAFAQVSGVRVVNNCGTPNPYSALQTALGSPAWLTVDANMTLCTNAVFTGTIAIGTVIQGASGSAADAWYVRPGTGASWVLGTGSNAIGSITNTGFTALQAGSANTSGNPFFVQCVGGTCSGGGGSGGGFTPAFGYSTPLAITNTSATTALPAGATTGSVIKVYNRGPAPFFWTAGTSGAVATTSMAQLGPNAWDSFVVPNGTTTNIAAVTSASSLTATLNTELGSGQPSGAAGPAGYIGALGVTVPASAAYVGYRNGSGQLDYATVDASHNQNVNIASGSVTATFASFAPNGNYATLAVSGSSSSVALPTGTVVAIYNTGSFAAFVKLGVGSATAVATNDQVAPGGFLCFAVGSNTFLGAIETGGATNLNISGGTGGCAGSGGGGGGGGGSGAPADTTLASTGTISTANVYGTGLTVQTWQNGLPVITGTPTANSAMSFTGFAGWNTGYLECTGGGTIGTNYFEVDRTSGASASPSVWKRVSDWTGPATSQTINLAGAVAINVVAAQYASGTLACAMRVSVNYATQDSGNGPVLANNTASISMTSATTTQVIAAVPGLPIYITGVSEYVSDSATGVPAWTFVYGTGSNCVTGTTTLPFSAKKMSNDNGSVRQGTVGAQITVPPGNALCVTTSAAPTGGALGIDVSYAQ